MIQYVVRGHDLTQGVVTPSDLADQIAKQGISSVQLALGISFKDMPSNAVNINPGMGSAIRQSLARKDIDIAILSCYINMIHPDLTIREQLLQKFESYVRHAKYFGAAMVASETGNVLPDIIYTEDNFTEQAFETLVPVIQRLVDTGEKHNVLIGIEPGLNHPLYALQRVEQLLEKVRSDYLGIILDPTNLISVSTHLTQVDLVKQAFERFGDKIVAVHLKDFVIENNQVIPTNMGTGLIKYKQILEIVQAYKPYCYVVLEETKDDFIGKALTLLNA